MNLKKPSQITTEELLGKIQTPHRSVALKDAVISVVYTKRGDGTWNYLIGKCAFQNDVRDVLEIYTDIAFCRKVIKDFDLSGFFADLDSTGFTICEGLPPLKCESNGCRWNEELIPGNFTSSNVPEHKYTAKLSQNGE